MNLDYLRSVIFETKKELLNESGFSRVRQIMLGQVPSIDSIGILTAENPEGKRLSPEENSVLMRDMKAQLQDMSVGYTDIGGSFGGSEKSIFIMNISRDDTTQLGLDLGQEAVIWGQKERDENNGPFYSFEYIEGTTTIQTRDVSMSDASVQSREDFYSEKAGRKFWIPFFEDEFQGAKPSMGGRRISFEKSEIPPLKETKNLAQSINKRNIFLLEKDRTNKSRWHHRNIMREEIKILNKIMRKYKK
tara:strand:- start:834 stop:1574 length:741 start_codon:yes stop_codon:yes gene_type:complete